MQDATRADDSGLARRTRLGVAIRAARRPRSQVELASDLGRPQASISQWESGQVDLSAERIFRLEDALDVPHGHLLLEAGYLDLAGLIGLRIPEAEVSGPLAAGPRGFPENVRRWMETFGPLLEAIILLRESGAEPSALDALLETRPVRTLRSSWEFLASLPVPPEERPDRELAAVLGAGAVVRCRYALWGERIVQLVPATT